MQKSIEKISKAYTLFIVLLPFFSVYASGLPGFTVGDIILLLFFIYRIVTGIKEGHLSISFKMWPIMLLVIMIPIITIISMLGQTQTDSYSVIIRIVRRLFYYLCVVLISGEWFDADYAKKAIITAGKIGAIYLFTQYIAYYGGRIVLHGYLPFLPVYHESYSQLDYQSLYRNMFRPTSFLLEPAHFARYACISLVFLVHDRQQENSWAWSFILSAAIVASTSGTGTLCVALIWGIWIINSLKEAVQTGKLKTKHIVILLLIAVALMASFGNNVVQSTINRISNTNLTDINTAGGARFRGYLQYFQLPPFNLIFGMGYGSTPNTSLVTWFSGASYILYGCGLMGFLICMYLFIKLYSGSVDFNQKVLCAVFFLLFFIDDCFMSHVSVLFLSFICMGEKRDKSDPAVELNLRGNM